MRCFGWTPDFVRFKITSAQGWIYYDWAKQNETTMFGAAWKRKNPGYVAQEREAVLKKMKGET